MLSSNIIFEFLNSKKFARWKVGRKVASKQGSANDILLMKGITQCAIENSKRVGGRDVKKVPVHAFSASPRSGKNIRCASTDGTAR